MSRTLVSLVTTALVVAALAPGAIGGAAADDVTLTVTTVDSNNETVGNIQVQVSWDGGSETVTTRSNGQALVDVPDGERVELRVNDSTYIRNFPYVIESASAGEVEVPMSQSGTATLTVVDSEGPVRNANIQMFRDGRTVDTKQTGEDGTVTTDRVERGGYGLRVSKAGYLTNGTGVIVNESSVEKTVRLRTKKVLVTFNVTDPNLADPLLDNASVDIEGGATLTANDGVAGPVGLTVNRNYPVTVTKDGYESSTTTLRVNQRATGLNVSLVRVDALNIEADRKEVLVNNTVDMTVTDEYGEAVAGATVSVDGSEEGQTDDTGRISVPINTAGNVTVQVTSGSLSDSVVVKGVEAAPDETPTPTPAVTATATATAEPTATAEGTATATADGTETPGDSGPGFGIVAALAAIAAVLLVGRRN